MHNESRGRFRPLFCRRDDPTLDLEPQKRPHGIPFIRSPSPPKSCAFEPPNRNTTKMKRHPRC